VTGVENGEEKKKTSDLKVRELKEDVKMTSEQHRKTKIGGILIEK
jgi:hypothetical protein